MTITMITNNFRVLVFVVVIFLVSTVSICKPPAEVFPRCLELGEDRESSV